MTAHLNWTEQHDAAYGFEPSGHHCEGCDAGVDALRRERDALAKWISMSPPVDVRFEDRRGGALGAWTIAAAASLLAMLLIFLAFPPGMNEDVAPAQDEIRDNDRVGRMVKELRSPNPLKRKAAREILLHYDMVAVPHLDKAAFPEAKRLAHEIRMPSPAARALFKRLETERISIRRNGVTLEDAIAVLRKKTKIIILIDAQIRDGIDLEREFDLDIRDRTIADAIRTLLKPYKAGHFCTPESVVLITRPGLHERGRARNGGPWRIPFTNTTALDGLLRDLHGADDTAFAGLSKRILFHGLEAENRLWPLLDSPDPRVARRVGDVLKRLYRKVDRSRFRESVDMSMPLSLDLINASLTDFLDLIQKRTGVNMTAVGEELDDERITIKVKDLMAESCLKLALNPRDWSMVELDGVLFLAPKGFVERTTRFDGNMIWMATDDLQKYDRLVRMAVRNPDDAFEKLDAIGPECLPILRFAAARMRDNEAKQLRKVIDRLVDEFDTLRRWMIDEKPALLRRPPRDDRERDLRKTLRTRTVSLDVNEESLSDVLDTLARQTGLKLEAKGDDTTISLFRVRNARLFTVLQLLARPSGRRVHIEKNRVILK